MTEPMGGSVRGAPFGLLADLGGTNARFAFSEDGRVVSARTLRVADYPDLATAIGAYLDGEPGKPRPSRAAIAIACPIVGDRVEMTNSAWSFSITELKAGLGFESLQIINDFTAVARSVPHLGPEDVHKIGGGEAEPDTPIAVIGPGTGLGVSALVPMSGGWFAIAGEGGHVTMPAVTERESQVLRHLRGRYSHVSAERVISGMGLVNLYESLGRVDGVDLPLRDPAAVSDAALARQDDTCVEALEMFCAMLGTIAGNLALSLGATGGVYIAGGIVPRLGERFDDSLFRERFEAKGRFADYLRRVPSFVVTHRMPAFLGLQSLLGTDVT